MTRPAWTKSLRFQLTFWYVVTLAGILTLAAVLVVRGVRAALLRETDQTLVAEANRIALALAPPPDEGGEHPDPPEAEDVVAQVGAASVSVQGVVTDALLVRLARVDSNRTVALSSTLTRQKRLSDALATARFRPGLSFVGPDEEGQMRCLSLTLPRTPYRLQVATPWDHREDLLARLTLGLGLALALFLLLSALGSWLLVGRALRPIAEIVSEAEQLTADRLTPTALQPRALSDNEVGRLVVTLNGMLSRLHVAFAAQRQFTADASHELRTPLTILQGEMETALSRERPPEEYRRVLGSGLEETGRMARIVDSLAFLARGDSGPREGDAPRRVPVPLGELAQAVAESLRPQADKNGLRLVLNLDSEVTVSGDPDELRRAFRNLLDNAIRYTPPGGRITVSTEAIGSECRLSVADTGVGVSPENLPHIFERFFRADKARVNDGGSGLGLAIVQRIIATHGGRLGAESTAGAGSRFTVTLPRD